MTREDKCKLAIEKGFTYNKYTGLVYGIRGNIIKSKIQGYNVISFRYDKRIIQLRAHHFAWYLINNEIVEEIDHIDGDRFNNKMNNLRSVNRQENQWNRTTAKGYCFDKKSNKWRASIKANNKKIYLGCFNNEDDARKSYIDAKKIYHIINENKSI